MSTASSGKTTKSTQKKASAAKTAAGSTGKTAAAKNTAGKNPKASAGKTAKPAAKAIRTDINPAGSWPFPVAPRP